MKQFSRLTILALALMPATALAQVKTYYHVGAWSAFSGRTPTGGAVCGIATSAGPRTLSIQFQIGGNTTEFIASKPDWVIPNGASVSVVQQIGLNTPVTVKGTGHGHEIAWTLDHDAGQSFDGQFQAAASMTLSFPDGNEPPWKLSLTGSKMISETFARCIHDLTKQVSAGQNSNQPQSSAPTQPFAAPAKADSGSGSLPAQPQAGTQPAAQSPAPSSPTTPPTH